MKNMNIGQIFKRNWIHFLAIGVFLLTTFIYFQPQFDGYGLKQHDIVQFQGMSREIVHYRQTHDGKDPLWTNSMFGGMPAFQISMSRPGNLIRYVSSTLHAWMSSPAGMFFAYLLCFYIMLLCMRVDPKLSILGSFAFAFSTYYLLILPAGHNAKAAAIGFAPLLIGAFYLTYRGKFKWGILLSALFMALELQANHVQVTYYIGILMLFITIAEFVRQIKQKTVPYFVKASIGLLVAYGFAFGLNYGILSLTKNYAQYTIRGANHITINPDGTSNKQNASPGLDKDYITQWSMGVDESMTLLSPYTFGSASKRLSDSRFADLLRTPEFRSDASNIANQSVYWGNQPFTSGPVYVGIIMFFLALLGMIYLKGPWKWGIFAATILALMLSWGKNFMGLTDFFIDYVPLYNKFRAVTIILVVVELTIPLLAVLFLDYLFKNKEEIKNNIKPFYYASGILVGLFLILTYTGLGNGYMSSREKEAVFNYRDNVTNQIMQMSPLQLQANHIDLSNKTQIKQIVDAQVNRVNDQFNSLVAVRKSIYRSSMWRSILFLLVAIAFIVIYLRTDIKKGYIVVGLIIFVLADLVPVDLNYMNNDKTGRDYNMWVKKDKFLFPLAPTAADLQILNMETANNPRLKKLVDSVENNSNANRQHGRINQNELWLNKFQTLDAATDYRVYNPSLGFNDASVSYFHKSLNGYHGAKLRRIQNVKDFYINYNNMDVYNMLNVKYFIQNGKAMKNPEALGPVWLVRSINIQPNQNKELLALGTTYLIKNFSEGKLLINNQKEEIDTISGREKVALFINNDTLAVNLNQVRSSGVNASFVQDINGKTNWIPTDQLQKDYLNSFKTLIRIEKLHEFDPRNEAILSQETGNKLSSLTFSGQGTIDLTDYAPNKLVYKVSVPENQFAVFSEMYYPEGWNAYINGKKVPILRADYLLRGIELPKGNYTLEMRFDVPLYHTANTIEFAGSILLFALIIGAFVKDFILPKKEEIISKKEQSSAEE